MQTPGITLSRFVFVTASHVIFAGPPVPSKIPYGNLPRRIARNDLVAIAPQCYRSHRCFHIKAARVGWISQVPQLDRSILAPAIQVSAVSLESQGRHTGGMTLQCEHGLLVFGVGDFIQSNVWIATGYVGTSNEMESRRNEYKPYHGTTMGNQRKNNEEQVILLTCQKLLRSKREKIVSLENEIHKIAVHLGET